MQTTMEIEQSSPGHRKAQDDELRRTKGQNPTFFNYRLEVALDLRASLILPDYLAEACARLLKNFLKRLGGFGPPSDPPFFDSAGLRFLWRDPGWRFDSPRFHFLGFAFLSSPPSDPFLFPDWRLCDPLEVERFFGLLPERLVFD